jgi:hypothetical protein
MLNLKETNLLNFNDRRPDRKDVVNSHALTELFNKIETDPRQVQSPDNRILALRDRVNAVTQNFHLAYKEMIGQEMRIINLNIAADSIKDRDDLVEQIYNTVIKEVTVNHS